jgi:endonuclease III
MARCSSPWYNHPVAWWTYRGGNDLGDLSCRERALKVHHRLIEAYGEPEWRQHMDPVSELVSTILSQNTNDVNRDRAFQQLRERFSSWEDVRDADIEEIKDAIRVSGLANSKAPTIQRALRRITEERGELSLGFLQAMSVEEAKDWLTEIKGVGVKTASIVLLFSLDRPAFPVDTHVHRVTRRLSLVGQKASRERAHRILEEMMPEETYYAFHLNVIRHGREICVAGTPRCDECMLHKLCAYYARERAGSS